MEDNNVLISYIMRSENEKLIKLMDVAMDELTTKQYSDAARHFEEAYLLDNSQYLVLFMKVFCKCMSGTRGEVSSLAPMLTSTAIKTFNSIMNDESLTSSSEKDEMFSLVFKYFAFTANMLWKCDPGFFGETLNTTFELIASTHENSLSSYPELKKEVFDNLVELREWALKSDEPVIDAKLKELDETYAPPVKQVESKKGGCYVATCVYGSYDCPQVWTLRRYRDYKLSTTWYGRLFIKIYYAISPTLVKWFGNANWFKKMWKGKLDRMVTKCKEEGFDDTPYDDIEW